MSIPWLTTALALLPLLGAGLTALLKPVSGRLLGLVTALATLAVGAVVAVCHWRGDDLAVDLDWLPALGISYRLDLDGMGLAMAALTVLLVPLVLIAEWRTGTGEQGRWSSRSYAALVLLVESFSLFVFMAGDVVLFYAFFEATLVPMYFLIAGWGRDRDESSRAAVKFLLFGLAGGLIMLFGVVGTGALGSTALAAQGAAGGMTFDIGLLAELDLGGSALAKVVFTAFFIAFALKAPMVPGHTWLPQAAASSTPGGAALMVGVLDKLGTFGMIRFCVELFPGEARWATPVIVVLALVSILYGAFAAIGQRDLMRLVAFTSISHFGFMTLGVFALTTSAMSGAIFYMVNHGLSTGALYLLVGYLVARRGSADVRDFGGVVKLAPVAAGFTLLAGLAGCALPGTSSFVSEFLVMAGTWPRWPVVAAVAALGTVFAALYILWMYQRVMTGPVPDAVRATVTADLTGRERLAVIPLLVAILGLGFFPQPALHVIEPTSRTIVVEHAGATDPEPVVKGVK
ncbi:MAG: NADH-quinone oxidoreductase subunit M [Propionibacteriaceae bacterium]|jgi:NADH-quinone oxidoreductase subunit M|nr:NADH-quinone oxidoreductase subunit M [Propionibacteriaceae bacterium]